VVKPVLALDTATARATFAAGVPGSSPSDLVITEKRDLSRVLERAAGDVLRAGGWTAADLSGIVVADGPGGFTGLRIGVAFAKGLCRALGVPLLAAPSLLGAARAAVEGDGDAEAEYDALRGEVYRAAYRFAADGSVSVLQDPELVIAGAAGGEASRRRATERHASAAALIRLTGVAGGPQPVADPAAWEPVYGRLAEAEARRLARHD